jgi:hypothetical protein
LDMFFTFLPSRCIQTLAFDTSESHVREVAGKPKELEAPSAGFGVRITYYFSGT